jgi:site-specific DNA-methyltransferase (adenine-specific)
MYTNKILCGDSSQVLSTFPEASVDLVIADPPYLGRYRDHLGRTLANDDKPEAVFAVYEQLFRVMKEGSFCVTFYGWVKLAGFVRAWDEAGFRVLGHIVWPKPYASGARYVEYRHEEAFVLAKGWPTRPEQPLPDLQPWEYSGNREHPTEKAVSVIAPLVRAFSEPSDLVLDPFSGSGSTAVAAALNGRRYVGIELERKYCDVAERRLAGVRRRCAWLDAA